LRERREEEGGAAQYLMFVISTTLYYKSRAFLLSSRQCHLSAAVRAYIVMKEWKIKASILRALL
jgi:hypothetical protein